MTWFDKQNVAEVRFRHSQDTMKTSYPKRKIKLATYKGHMETGILSQPLVAPPIPAKVADWERKQLFWTYSPADTTSSRNGWLSQPRL